MSVLGRDRMRRVSIRRAGVGEGESVLGGDRMGRLIRGELLHQNLDLRAHNFTRLRR